MRICHPEVSTIFAENFLSAASISFAFEGSRENSFSFTSRSYKRFFQPAPPKFNEGVRTTCKIRQKDIQVFASVIKTASNEAIFLSLNNMDCFKRIPLADFSQ